MAKNSCQWYPEVNGKPSKMYRDLLKVKKLKRPLANYIYAVYLSQNLADAMDNVLDANGNPKYKRNTQGQHSANDVWDFLNISSWRDDFNKLSDIELREGFVDNNGQRVDFTNAKDALEKADAFNDAHNGITATVVQHGDVFNIIAAEKNSRTLSYAQDVKTKLKVWEVEKHAFSANGIDIESMPQELNSIFSPQHTGLVQYLQNVQRQQINNILKKEALLLFSMDANSPQVQRLVGSFGSIEAAAQALDDFNHGANNLTTPQKTLLMRAVNHCKNMRGTDLDALKTQVAQMTQQVLSNSPDEDVRIELHKLNKKYKIEQNELHRTDNKIRTLSEAATDAVFVLQRQIRELEKIKGNNTEGKRMEATLDQLMRELESKKYYAGILNFLREASLRLSYDPTTQTSVVDNMLQDPNLQTGTNLEKAFKMAKVLQDIKSLKEQYYPLVSALADEHLVIDESIAQVDINNIRQTAKALEGIFNATDGKIDTKINSTMKDLLKMIVGETAPDGQIIENLVEMAAADSSNIDYLYSIGRASNPIIAAMGSIVRNAQDSRDGIMNDISLRIRRATDKLYKSGSNTEFMYEDDGHIISDIDWQAYKTARTAHIKSLYKQGLKGFDLKQAIEDWEDNNTEDRIVDRNNGRTERVPDSQFRKAFPTLTTAQREYYDTMMQLKGEIGSLLPAYAQKQYLPPQLRRNMLDAIGHAQNVGDVWTAIKNKAKDTWKIREDDENYNMNGIIDGNEYGITDGAFDNTPLRQIPIFFVNKVEQGELLKNFSTGIAALAGTAVNYDAMSNIAQVVEFIGDFAINQMSRDKEQKADMVENKSIRVFKDLWSWSKNNNTEDLIRGFISQHIYGQRLNPEQIGYKWSKLITKIIGYTSFKGLATNIKGAFSNYLVGEFQMLIEAGAGEFYNLKDFAWAHSKLFGSAGVGGEIAELLTNNMSHKSSLLREMFDPIQENFSDKSHTKYYKSMFRQLVSHDCSFLGYSSGEFLIHYVNMYGVLNHTKVKLNGETISLYDAFEAYKPQGESNAELRLKQGVTMLDGSAVTPEFIDSIRKKIRYVNQSTHGSMNTEDKGLIHQRLWGRAIMNFRQWMVEHYSRRFRGSHFDASLGMNREGYWVSLKKMMLNEDTKEEWKEGSKLDAIGMFMKDLMYFTLRAQSQWGNLNEMQKANVKRVHTEMMMYIALLGMSFAIGEPDRHKKDWWRRWWIYQVKRLILDTEASLPVPQAISSGLTILQSPMSGVNTVNSLLYSFYGITNGDIATKIKSGPHKGENKYWRNMKKYNLPFFKDWEQMQNLAEDESIFQVFQNSPSNH